jgi:NADH-quinone oxidoreductase subunit A
VESDELIFISILRSAWETIMMSGLWPIVVYFVAVLALVASMLVLSYLLGQRHTGRATGEPYESGIVSTGSARLRFSV